MTARQLLIVIGTLVVLAIALTVAAGQVGPAYAPQPLESEPLWYGLLRMAVIAIWSFLALFLVIAGVLWLVGSIQSGRVSPGFEGVDQEPLSEDLRRRFERGEISRSEYDRLRHDLD